jgi:hypothetical protein
VYSFAVDYRAQNALIASQVERMVKQKWGLDVTVAHLDERGASRSATLDVWVSGTSMPCIVSMNGAKVDDVWICAV